MPRIAFIAGAFHKTEVEQMLAEAAATASELGLDVIEVVWVPGALEKPLALKRLLLRDDIDGAAVFGIIERGQTKHGLVMGQAVLQSILQLQLETMKPVGIGILGPEILPDQISPRLLPYARDAVRALAHMLAPSLPPSFAQSS